MLELSLGSRETNWRAAVQGQLDGVLNDSAAAAGGQRWRSIWELHAGKSLKHKTASVRSADQRSNQKEDQQINGQANVSQLAPGGHVNLKLCGLVRTMMLIDAVPSQQNFGTFWSVYGYLTSFVDLYVLYKCIMTSLYVTALCCEVFFFFIFHTY